MQILDKLNEIINKMKQKNLKQGVQTVENTYQQTETREAAIKEASIRAIEEINAHPEMAVRILKMIEESKKLPKEVVVETIKKIPETESIENPEKTAIVAVEELDLNSGDIKEIIKEADISIPTAKEMATQIPNDELRAEEKKRLERIEQEKARRIRIEEQKMIKRELRKTYVDCDKIRDTELVGRLGTIKEKENNPMIRDMIVRILARKAAIECKQFGIARIPTMRKLITPEEMMELGFTEMVGEEFKEIRNVKSYNDRNGYPYNENDLKKAILKEIAKDVVKTYDEIGIIEVPQSEAMKNITENQEDYLVEQIQTYGRNIDEAENIRRQIRGKNNEQVDDLIKLLGKLPEKEREEYIKKARNELIGIIKEDSKNREQPEQKQKDDEERVD